MVVRNIFFFLVDFVSVFFMMDRINLYEGYEDFIYFFRLVIRLMFVSFCCNFCC